MRKDKLHILLFALLLEFNSAFAQYFKRCDTIPVKINNTWLKNPWVGGLNYCQFSQIDLNFDGIKDLFVFDRTGNKITTYINKGTPNMVDYVDSSSRYAPQFPHLEDWALLRDYNCDGKEDIFTFNNNGGIKVWKNTSSNGKLQFTLETSAIKTNYCPANLELAVTGVDVPTIDDVDNDGDLDILTFDAGGINLQYHINQSKESGYGCDSLNYKMSCNACWGNFSASISGCDVTLKSCAQAPPTDSTAINHHAGNCTLCIDMDGDGDKDLLMGQLGCCNLIELTNGGSSSSANITAMDIHFPSYNQPATLSSFPCGYFLDLNNDNKRDLIVSPNAPNVSIDNQSIWYYLNVGTDKMPLFSRQTRGLLQQDMIDVGEGADPVFFDFDSDGLTDLLISNNIMTVDSCPATNLYGVLAFKNIGTLKSPKFELVNSDYANLSTLLPSISGKHLTFGDIDGDGDADMFVGDFDGFIHYFKDTAAPGKPAAFTYVGKVNDVSGIAIDIGSYATPQLIDIDRDGDLDLITGEWSGNLNYYQNTGTVNSYSFTLISSKFGGVDVMKPCCTGYSIPFIYDSAGSYNMIVGSESSKISNNKTGWLWHYKNIDGNLAGDFTLTDSLYQNIWEGPRMTAFGNDINNDGYMDLVIGNYAGGVAIYLGDTGTVAVPEHNHSLFDFTIYPNPSKGQITINLSDLKTTEKIELNIYNMIGVRVFTTSRNHTTNNHKILHIDTSSLPNGLYSCEINILSSDKNQHLNSRLSKKLILINY